MLVAHVLLAVGAAIPGLFGCVPLFYTYHGNKLHPRDAAGSHGALEPHPHPARRYFFRAPFRGAPLVCLLYAAGWALMSVA